MYEVWENEEGARLTLKLIIPNGKIGLIVEDGGHDSYYIDIDDLISTGFKLIEKKENFI